MKAEVNINNQVFAYTIAGVLLLIAALVLLLTSRIGLAMHEHPYTIGGLVLAFGSVLILYKAFKDDKNRMKEV